MGHRGAVTTGSGRGRRRVAGAWDVSMDVDYTWWARMGEARERIAVTFRASLKTTFFHKILTFSIFFEKIEIP